MATKDEKFREFVESLPDKYWAKYDLSAVRLGWDAAKKSEVDCITCKGLGNIDDAELGDISCNKWKCPDCKGSGKQRLIIS